MENFAGIDTVLYTDFPPEGKFDHPTPAELAGAAVKSVGEASPGQDGISYLINAKAAGLETQLTQRYEQEILRLTSASTLLEPLEVARREHPDDEGRPV